MSDYACRFCGSPLEHTFVDLGETPLANAFLTEEALTRPEPRHPLKVYVCSNCLLVQLPEFESPEAIFSDYAYFSSFADTWLDHVERYAAAAIDRFAIDASSQVIEVASNDGHLLQRFAQRGIPVLGIEPAANVAREAESRGIRTLVRFFGAEVAGEVAADVRADLLVGNNVLAHVPDLNDFVAGLRVLLAPAGVLTLEFPHLARLMSENQFDTIYHEHFSYFSFRTARQVLRAHGLEVFDVDRLPTHGGSLRIYAHHRSDETHETSARVDELLTEETQQGFEELEHHLDFDRHVRATRDVLLGFLERARREGKRVACYGAPAKGNTLLNYCGVDTGVVPYTVDRSPHKQGLYLPGTHLPIHAPEHVFEDRPDYLLILPWNFRDEILEQMAGISEWGGRFVVAIPELEVI